MNQHVKHPLMNERNKSQRKTPKWSYVLWHSKWIRLNNKGDPGCSQVYGYQEHPWRENLPNQPPNFQFQQVSNSHSVTSIKLVTFTLLEGHHWLLRGRFSQKEGQGNTQQLTQFQHSWGSCQLAESCWKPLSCGMCVGSSSFWFWNLFLLFIYLLCLIKTG
jgi:hypothetical protein